MVNRCPICGCRETINTNVYRLDEGFPCEYDITCVRCGKVLDHFAYGCYVSEGLEAFKLECLKALSDIENDYDAFYIENKYGTNTHERQFELLSGLVGDKVPNALSWIRNCYDCFYKGALDEDSAFAYLEKIISEI